MISHFHLQLLGRSTSQTRRMLTDLSISGHGSRQAVDLVERFLRESRARRLQTDEATASPNILTLISDGTSDLLGWTLLARAKPSATVGQRHQLILTVHFDLQPTNHDLGFPAVRLGANSGSYGVCRLTHARTRRLQHEAVPSSGDLNQRLNCLANGNPTVCKVPNLVPSTIHQDRTKNIHSIMGKQCSGCLAFGPLSAPEPSFPLVGSLLVCTCPSFRCLSIDF